MFKDQRWARGQTWALARRHGTGMPLDSPGLRAACGDYEASARHHRSLRTAVARRGGKDVALPVDYAQIRRIEPVSHGWFRHGAQATPGHSGAIAAPRHAGRWHTRLGFVELNQVPALGGVCLGQKGLHRGVDKFRITIVALPVSKG